MIVDTHAHLDMEEFVPDLPEVVDRARAAGVGRILTIGIDLASSEKAVAIADRFPEVWATVGVHPHDAASWSPAVRRRLAELIGHPKVAAVGETGLDFYRDRSPRAMQAKAFREQIDLAGEHSLPIIVHAREAHRETLEILRGLGRPVKGVMHCFSGTLEESAGFLQAGLKLALGGPLTYPNAAKTRDLFTHLPVEDFLVETDCPYLPPQSHRGKRNEPAMVTIVVEKMAELKGLCREDIARITSENARELFGLGLEAPAGEIVYRIRRTVYLNITNRCPNRCTFCGRQRDFRVKGHDLRLEAEPSPADILAALSREKDFDEVVFCGYGEPLLRLDLVAEVARRLKERGLRIRVNTNGLASRIHGRSVPGELRGLVDAYSISLNAPDEETYQRLCRPETGAGSFGAVLDFAREASACGAQVILTAVAVPGIDLEACRSLAASLGAGFRVRKYNEVG